MKIHVQDDDILPSTPRKTRMEEARPLDMNFASPCIKQEPCNIHDGKTENIFSLNGIENSETNVGDVLEENDKTNICEDLIIKEESKETNITGDTINLTDDQIDIKEEQR